jgi:hypothetical protein
LAVLTAHAERIIRSIDALDVATEGSVKNELPLKIDPELGEVVAAIEQCLRRFEFELLDHSEPNFGSDTDQTASGIGGDRLAPRNAVS